MLSLCLALDMYTHSPANCSKRHRTGGCFISYARSLFSPSWKRERERGMLRAIFEPLIWHDTVQTCAEPPVLSKPDVERCSFLSLVPARNKALGYRPWMEAEMRSSEYIASKFKREHFENPKRYFNPDFAIVVILWTVVAQHSKWSSKPDNSYPRWYFSFCLLS